MVKSGASALKKFKMAVKSQGQAQIKSKKTLNHKRLITDNPFEKKFNNVKFDILNKKGASKSAALANAARPGKKKAMEFGKKRDSLRLELASRKRVGLVVDKRIGEYDASMSAEDKMLLRFMKEKAASSAAHSARNISFNLNDDDDDEVGGGDGLTHMGQSLSAIDDFTASGLEAVNGWDEEDADARKGGQIDADVVKFAHFGGFEVDEKDKANPMHKKSRNEIMKEIIQKSKMHKRERQMQKEQDLDLAEQVDADIDEIRSLLAPMSSAEALPASHNKMTVSSDRLRMIQGLDPLPIPKIEEYDRVFRELARDGRAAPTDRQKSETELAMEAADRLRAAETKRARRMQGLDSDDSNDSETESRGTKKRKDKGRKGEEALADDLGDDVWGAQVEAVRDRDDVMPLTYDKEGRLINNEIFMKPKDSSSEDDEDDDDDDDGSEGDSESDGEDDSNNDGSDDESQDDEEEEEKEAKIGSLEPDFESINSAEIEADNDMQVNSSDDESEIDSDQAALEEMYEGNSSASSSDGEEEKVVKPKKRKRGEKEKIIQQATKELPYTFDAPTCFAEFKELVKGRSLTEELVIVKRLLILYNVKLDGRNRIHMENLSCILMERVVELGNTKKGEDVEKMTKYRNQAVQLARLYPNAFAKWCKTELKTLRDSFNKRSSTLSKITAFPGPGHITMFADFSRIFSCSDLQHQVMSPVMLLLSQYLAQAPISCPNDGLIGIVICHIFFSYTCDSKRYLPEVVSFLHLMLYQCLKGCKGVEAPGYLSTVRKCAVGVLSIQDFAAEYDELSLNELYCSSNDNSTSSSQKMILLHECIGLLVKFCKLWNDTSCIIDVFGETMDIIKQIPSANTNPKLMTQIAEASRMIGPLLESSRLKRRPLQLQKRKAVAIKTYVPKFHTSYSIDKRYDPDHARAQEGKLKAEYKKEFKGAVRELRKDAAFLVREKLEKLKESDAVYKKKMDKIVGQLAEQEGAMRGFEKAAKKKSKRR